MPLDDEWAGASVDAPKVDAGGEKVGSGFDKALPVQSGSASEDGLSLVAKLALVGVIVAACVAFVKAYSPQKAGFAGRSGAYEKAGV